MSKAAKKAREENMRYIIRKVRHAMLCTGTPPESVDERLGWKRGRTRALVRGWPSRPVRLQRGHTPWFKMRLDDISDICLACGGEMDFRLEPIKEVEEEVA